MFSCWFLQEYGRACGYLGGGTVALLGCTVVPGFDFADYRNASHAELAAKWPEQAERIKALTRS